MTARIVRSSRLLARRTVVTLALAFAFAAASPARAGIYDAVPDFGSEIAKYLLIGMGPVNDFGGLPGIGSAVDISNYEIGAIKAPVPPDSSYGPGLLGNVPAFPSGVTVGVGGNGISGDGNVAITSGDGKMQLSNVGVYADVAIDLARPISGDSFQASNSYMNDPNHYPNTIASGTPVAGNPANLISAGNGWPGVNPSVNFGPTGDGGTGLLPEIASLTSAIAGAAQTSVLNLSGSGGEINNNNAFVFNAVSGLNIVDINTGGNDFKITNSNFIVNGPADAFVIFRLPDEKKMIVTESNLLINNGDGAGGIGHHNVAFFTDADIKGDLIEFNEVVVNGIAFLVLGNHGGGVNWNDVVGCTQIIADKINLQDVRLARCFFGEEMIPGDDDDDEIPPIPTPAAAPMILAGLGLLALRRRPTA